MEDNQEQKKGEPLLYIHQPTFPKPNNVQMQDSFYTTNAKKDEKQKKTSKEIEKPSFPMTESLNKEPSDEKVKVTEDHQQDKEDLDQRSEGSAVDYFRKTMRQTKRNWTLSPVKSFREMTIPEKLQYLSRFPVNQQPYPCEYIMDEKKVKGNLSKYEEGKIHVSTLEGETAEIHLNDIRAIRILL